MKTYIKMDMYRAVTGRSFWVAVVGVCLVNFLSSLQCGFNVDVYTVQYFFTTYSLYILEFAFGSLAYANCFVEDAEHKFWYQSIQRGNIRNYTKSKVYSCFVAAVVATVFGIIIFVFLMRVRMPFFTRNNPAWKNIAEHSVCGFFANEKTILIYFLGVALLQGLLAGILSLVSMLLSLFVKNRMFTISIPVIGFYFLTNYLGNFSTYFDLAALYVADFPLFQSNIVSFCYDILLAFTIAYLIGNLICMKVEREIKAK